MEGSKHYRVSRSDLIVVGREISSMTYMYKAVHYARLENLTHDR